MPDYVQYHNVEERGYRCRDILAPKIYTNKKPDHVVGSRIWLIAGERSAWNGKKRYFACYAFVAEEVSPSDEADYKYLITGREIARFAPPVPLDGLPWFAGFRRKVGNFGLGLSPIAEPFGREFSELLGKHAGRASGGLFS